MASISDLCWTSAEDLFEDVDLDDLYMRQLTSIGAEHWESYPYLILIHTGKIAIGINLGRAFERQDRLTAWTPGDSLGEAPLTVSHSRKDPSD